MLPSRNDGLDYSDFAAVHGDLDACRSLERG